MSMSEDSKMVMKQYNDAIKFISTDASKLEKISKIRLARVALKKYKEHIDAELKTFNPKRALWKKILTIITFPILMLSMWSYKIIFLSMFIMLFIFEEIIRYNSD